MFSKRRALALTTAAVVFFCVCISSLYIVHKAEHKCTGDDCEICSNIDICLIRLNNVTPEPEVISFVFALTFIAVMLIGIVKRSEKHQTLINLKVKLTA